MKKIFFVLCVLTSFSPLAYADVSIQSIFVELFHGKDGRLKPLGSQDIDFQTADAQLLIKIHIVANGETPDRPELKLTLEGFGKGRDNEAEGKVEDWKFKESRKSYSFSNYEAFLATYPCAEKVKLVATITSVKNSKKILSKKEFETNQLNCSMN